MEATAQHGQPVDYFELEQQRLFSVANSMALAITEGFGDYVDNREWQWDDPSFGFGRVGQPVLYTSLNDRSDGKYLPIFQTEMDLRAIRAEARNVMAMSSGLQGAIGTLSNYTFGPGIKFKIQKAANCPAGVAPEAVASLIVAAQSVVDKFLLDNKFSSNLDREIDSRTREDGEVFLELTPSPCGRILATIDEPDQICQPSDPGPVEEWLECGNEWVWSWTFGVHCRQRTPSIPMGYHVVYDTVGDDWDYVSSDRMLHIKRNVPRNVKRGVSDLYWVANDVQREFKIRKNTADGAALQAAIAWIREHAAGVTQSQVQGIVTSGAVATRQQPTSEGTRPTKRGTLKSGTVVDVPVGLKYTGGPMGSERNPNFILVAQYVSRAIAQRWAMPEYMFTSDASNANYASTLVAESPFTKAREADQRFYCEAFIELLWKVLRLAHEIGKLQLPYNVIQSAIEIKAEPPRVAVRDDLQAVQRLQAEVDLGITSIRTAASEMERDYDQELEQGAKPKADPAAAGGDQNAQGQGAAGLPTSGDAPPEMAALSRLQWTRNVKAIKGILAELRSGDINEALAVELLTATGFARDRAERLVHGDVDPEVEAALKEVPENLAESVLECGGEGGKPGPCPSAGSEQTGTPSKGGQSGSDAGESQTPKPRKPRAPVASKSPPPPVTPDVAQARTRTPQDFEKVGEKLVNRRKLEDPANGIDVKSGVAAVRNYTDSDNYEPMNRALREGGDPTKVPPQPQTAHLQTLSKQPLSEPTVVYRGISEEMFDTQFSKAKVGAVITAKGFQSTSVDPGVGAGFAAGDTATRGYPVLEIKAKTGLFAGDLSHAENEHEVIQAHGTRYRLIGIEHGVKVHHRTVSMIRVEEI